MILLCGFISSLCLHTPLFIGATQARKSGRSPQQIIILQLLLGLAYGLGSYLSGLVCMRARRKKTCAMVILCGGLGLLLVQCVSLLELSLLSSSLLAGLISCALKVFLYKSARSHYVSVLSLFHFTQSLPSLLSVLISTNCQYGALWGGVSNVVTSLIIFLHLTTAKHKRSPSIGSI